MTPERVWAKFLEQFPSMESQVSRWYKRRPSHRSPDGADSIRIVLKNGNTLIFRCYKNGNWNLDNER